MREALEKSCNVYFYTLGNLLGVDRIHKWATALGLGEMSGIDLPHETQGIMPSTAWKKQRTGEKWYAGETISVAIGQGQVSVTPISLAVMMASVANGGRASRSSSAAAARWRWPVASAPTMPFPACVTGARPRRRAGSLRPRGRHAMDDHRHRLPRRAGAPGRSCCARAVTA